MSVLAFAVGLAFGLVLGGTWSVARLRRPRHRHDWGPWSRLTVNTRYHDNGATTGVVPITKQHRTCTTCGLEEIAKLS